MNEHYFIERFFSVAIYFAMSCLLCFFVAKGKKPIRLYFFVYSIFLAILSWFIIPSESMDLYRLWITADAYNSNLSVFEVTTSVLNSTWSGPLSILYVILISRINHHLLPALTVFLFYNNIFYIVSDYSKKNKNISRIAIAVVLFLFLSRGIYGEVVSGIRSMLGFSFLSRLIYDEVYNKKSLVRHLPWLLLLALFHQALLVGVGLWIILRIVFVSKGVKRIGLIALGLICLAVFLQLFGNVIENVNSTASHYLDSGGYYYVWEYFFNGFYMLICIYLFIFYSNKSIVSEQSLQIKRISLSLFAICIAFIYVYSIFHRYISFVSFFSLPALIEILDKNRAYPDRKRILQYVLIVACFMFFLSGLKGNLNGIQFFVFG